jgi:hypothetical protein
MTNPQQVKNLVGSAAFDVDGGKIGKVGQVYLNDETGDAEWVTVHTGLFGARESFAPLHGAQGGDGEVRLAVTRQQVKDAPHVSAHKPLEGADVDVLYQHYAGYTGREAAGPGPGSSGRTAGAVSRSGARLHAVAGSGAAPRVRPQGSVVAEVVSASDEEAG